VLEQSDPEQPVPEQLVPEKLCPEQLVPEKLGPEQLVPEKLGPEEPVSEQLGPEEPVQLDPVAAGLHCQLPGSRWRGRRPVDHSVRSGLLRSLASNGCTAAILYQTVALPRSQSLSRSESSSRGSRSLARLSCASTCEEV
jgi:hypothetical protein